MNSRFLFLAAVALPLLAVPANASLVVLYENDFNTRTSVGPVGGPGEIGPVDGLYTFDYSIGNLIDASVGVAGQDL